MDRRGLTMQRTHLMWVLHHQGPSTQAQLAAAVGVTPRYVTTLVDALDATGLAVRGPHPTDRRAVLVDLTDRGRETMTAMAEEHVQLGTALTDGLDETTVAAAVRAIDHARKRLEQLIAENESAQAARAETP